MPANACARGAPLAIIDSALATDHPALRGANVTRRSFLPSGAAPSSGGHATAIASLLVGDMGPGVAPLAPGARLLVAETFQTVDGKAKSDTLAIIRGIDWAVQSGARVIAMSLEGAANLTMEFAVRRSAARANLIAAAGNSGRTGRPAYPAAYPDVMAVSAVDARLRPYRNGTRGTYVEIAAPGAGIISAAPGGGKKAWSGTSFAVPFVAAAMLRARAVTDGQPDAARALLRRNARDLGAPGPDEIYGHGLLQMPGGRCW
jgi:subtilisin family serine protease